MSAPWIMWLAAAGVIVLLEIFSGTFYLLMIAIGVASGAAAAWLGYSLEWQIMVSAIIGVVATGLLHRSRLGRIQRQESSRDPNVNLDIGQTIYVSHWQHPEDGHPVSRVSYRGAPWDVELAKGSHAEPGNYVISEIRGSRLYLTRHPS